MCGARVSSACKQTLAGLPRSSKARGSAAAEARTVNAVIHACARTAEVPRAEHWSSPHRGAVGTW
eukprot:2396972-Alexandrium_andersonii.AAC.1